MKIYVASSWRNLLQPGVVTILRRFGHEVYDFRNPPKGTAFSWGVIDKDWRDWTPAQYREALNHPTAMSGYFSDVDALKETDACVLVLPAGRSASFELGYAMALGKKCYVLQVEKDDPELMYREAKILISIEELMDEFCQE